MIPCAACGQALYPLERMTLNSKVYHKQGCARCSDCNTNLNISNFAFVGDRLYCKTHYLANFQRSGGRYSFDGTNDPAARNTPARVSVKVVDPRPTSSASVFATSKSVEANATPNRLSAFLSSPAVGGPARTEVNKHTTTSAPTASVQSKPAAAGIASTSSKQPVVQPSSTNAPKTSSTTTTQTPSKLSAFLSNPNIVSPASSAAPRPQESARVVDRTSVGASKPETSSVRPVSLKERIEAYAAEVSGAKKAAVPQSGDLPPLPTKDKAFERTLDSSRRPSAGTVGTSSRSASVASSATTTSTVSSSTPAQNRLSVFLQQYPSPTTATASASSATASSVRKPSESSVVTRTQQDENKSQVSNQSSEDELFETRPRPVSIRDRINAYTAVATKATEPSKPPPLPPAKPTYDQVMSKSPKKQSSSSFFGTAHKKDSIASTASSQSVPTTVSDVNTSTQDSSRPMSLKERIASYQARASGARLRSPARKSLDKSMTKESPTKRPSLRSRFFKNPVYASPVGGKSSELSRIARKICDEGISQLTRTSVKYPETDEKIATVVHELKLSLESTLKQLRLLESDNKQRTIPG